MEWGWDNGRALIGIAAIFALAWAVSENRRVFPWKIALGAVALQFAFAGVLFGVPLIRHLLFSANGIVDALQGATRAGTGFVFGYIGDNTLFSSNPTVIPGDYPPPLFFFQILPIVIVVTALSALLWHWGLLRWLTRRFSALFTRLLGLGGATSLGVAANVFMGMTEAPVLVRPYLKTMSRSELFILMTAGFATIAGSVLIVYVTFLEPVMANPLAQLLTASFMATPAAVALAWVIVPENQPVSAREAEPDLRYHSSMDAFSTGASDGMKILLNIATMLIAALAVLYLVNQILALPGTVAQMGPGRGAAALKVLLAPLIWLDELAGEGGLTLQWLLGWLFAPLMYLIGIPWSEAATAGGLMGIKTVLTEFVAFLDLANASPEALSPRSRIIMVHALCGFANFGSIGILIGGLSIIEPARRDVFLGLVWKTLLAGTLATCLSGAVVGALPAALFLGVA